MSAPNEKSPSRETSQPEFLSNETSVPYRAGRRAKEPKEDQGWIDFRDQCRRQMRRPIDQRVKYGFCLMYKPVLDDAPWRAFSSMAEYRAWCEANLPEYLGFKPGKP